MPLKSVRRTFTYSSAKLGLIQRMVAEDAGMTVAELLQKDRRSQFVRNRQIAMYLSREIAGASYPEIGRQFMRDHTTCVYAFARVEFEMKKDEAFRVQVNDLAYTIQKKWKESNGIQPRV